MPSLGDANVAFRLPSINAALGRQSGTAQRDEKALPEITALPAHPLLKQFVHFGLHAIDKRTNIE